MTTRELAALLGGAYDGPDTPVIGYEFDSRRVQPGDAFFAVRGESVDGFAFIESALAAGAVVAVTDRPAPDAIVVPDVVEAIARMGRTLRNAYHGPVVGITGSVGKTTAKEFLAAALLPLGEIVRTQGNRNTEYTAPLLWSDVDEYTAAVIVEMGMRGPGQIRHLAEIARPSAALITNVGHTHLELLGSRDAIAEAKGEMIEVLPADGWVVLWREDDYFDRLRDLAGGRPCATFGFGPHADCRIIETTPVSWTESIVKGFYIDLPWEAHLPAPGRHMALNAAAAIAMAVNLGVSPQEAAESLSQVELPPLRMEIREWHGATVVLDSYNAAPASVRTALETLIQLPTAGRRYAILGTMRELGDSADSAHRDIVGYANGLGLDGIAFVGDMMSEIGAEMARGSGNAYIAPTPQDLTAFFAQIAPGDTVLIKGSRSLALEDALPE